MTAFVDLAALAPLAALSLAGCGLNSVPTAEEKVNAKWANVQSEYQRRADLIRNLVETVKGYAKQEKDRADRGDRGAVARTGTQLSAADLSIRPRCARSTRRRPSSAFAHAAARRRFSRPIRTSSRTRIS